MKISLLITLLLLLTNAYAIYPVNSVYRVDDRSIENIETEGGMRPYNDGTPDYDLTHHFEGRSIDDHVSAFVSTSSSLQQAVTHAASLARPNSFESFDADFVTYLYVIRPSSDFYEVLGSLSYARDQAPQNSTSRATFSELISDYADMEEIVALNGFSADRLMSYAEITGDMLNQYYDSGQMFMESFWSSRWIQNSNYNSDYDNDASNGEPYSTTTPPIGVINIVRNGTQPIVLLGDTCMGVGSSSNSQLMKFSVNSGAGYACSGSEYLLITHDFCFKPLAVSLGIY